MLSLEQGPPVADPLFEVDLFLVAFAIVGSLILLGFLFVAYSIFRSYRAARRAGLDPFASEAQVIAQAISRPGMTLEQRLTELDDLHRRGVISSQEHLTARQRALSGA